MSSKPFNNINLNLLTIYGGYLSSICRVSFYLSSISILNDMIPYQLDMRGMPYTSGHKIGIIIYQWIACDTGNHFGVFLYN